MVIILTLIITWYPFSFFATSPSETHRNKRIPVIIYFFLILSYTYLLYSMILESLTPFWHPSRRLNILFYHGSPNHIITIIKHDGLSGSNCSLRLIKDTFDLIWSHHPNDCIGTFMAISHFCIYSHITI